MGFIASGYWIFAPDLVVNLSALPADRTGWLWLAVGIAGLAGLYLLSGIRLLPGRLSMGPVLPFIAIAIGQAVGSPAMGLAIKHLDYAHAFALFSTIGLFAAMLSPLYPRHLDFEEDAQVDAEPEETEQPAAEETQLEQR